MRSIGLIFIDIFAKKLIRMKIIAIIPARSGSKGLRNKNIKLLGGHPLLSWSIITCRKTKLIDYVLVSTNSKKYAKIATKYGAKVPFLRPASISGNISSDYEFIDHALNKLRKFKISPEIVVHIRPTTPLRDPKQIDKAIKHFVKNKSRATALRSVHEMSETVYKVFEISDKKLLKPIFSKNKFLDKINLPRQKFKKTYVANGMVDIYSVSFVKKNKMLLGSKVIPFIVSPTTEVDNINDFKYLEYQVRKNPKILTKIFKS